jgi:hypothetical protein
MNMGRYVHRFTEEYIRHNRRMYHSPSFSLVRPLLRLACHHFAKKLNLSHRHRPLHHRPSCRCCHPGHHATTALCPAAVRMPSRSVRRRHEALPPASSMPSSAPPASSVPASTSLTHRPTLFHPRSKLPRACVHALPQPRPVTSATPRTPMLPGALAGLRRPPSPPQR